MDKELIEKLAKAGLIVGEVAQVPHYSCGVRAGIPEMPGDYAGEYSFIPKSLLKTSSYTIEVRGESMRDFDLKDGDELLCRSQSTADSGDIVIASIDGSFTVKTFFEDEEGLKWLLPGNPDFQPIQLTPDRDCRIVALVLNIIHKAPRTSYNECMRILKRQKVVKKRTFTNSDIARALKVAQQYIAENNMSESRSWYAAYRVFVDREIVGEGEYSSFNSILQEIMGEEAPSINIRDMRTNMEIGSFALPVIMWNVNDAPVAGKRFADYLELARRINLALVGKS